MTKPIRSLRQDVYAVVLVPSESEWQALRLTYPDLRPGVALGREFLSRSFGRRRMVFVNTGEEALEAAVSAQYAIDRWSPRVLATDASLDAFFHVAERNRLHLTPVEDLGVNAGDLATSSTIDDASGDIIDRGIDPFEDVSTTDDVATIDDVVTTEEAVTLGQDTVQTGDFDATEDDTGSTPKR